MVIPLTILNMCNSLQFGMARMFSAMVINEVVEVIINQQNNNVYC